MRLLTEGKGGVRSTPDTAEGELYITLTMVVTPSPRRGGLKVLHYILNDKKRVTERLYMW